MSFVLDPARNSLGLGILVNQIKVKGEALQMETLKQVAITNDQGSHEDVNLSVSLTTSQVDALQDGPISFSYGPRASLGRFYGYVSEIAPSRNYQANLMYDLHCIGATRPLQQSGQPRFYVKKSITTVLADLIKARSLGVQIENSDFLWPTLAQTSESDWEFITLWAKRCGYAVYNYNGVVRIVDPLRILNESGPVIRLIKGDEVLDKSRVLLDFNPTAYSKKKPKYIHPAFGYFNNGKARITHEVSDTYNFQSSPTILDKTMADFVTKAWESSVDNWVQKATARIQGNTTLHPGVVISVQISGSSVIQHDYDGLWLVTGTHHDLTAGSFQTSLNLARDNKKRLSNIGLKPWTQGVQAHPQLSQATPSSDWRSSWKTTQIISANIGVGKPKVPSNPVWTS